MFSAPDPKYDIGRAEVVKFLFYFAFLIPVFLVYSIVTQLKSLIFTQPYNDWSSQRLLTQAQRGFSLFDHMADHP